MSAGPSRVTRGHPWFAATYDFVMNGAESSDLGVMRRDLLQRVAGRVLEVGVGTGVNLNHYPAAIELLVATEPDPFMLTRAVRRAAKERRSVELLQSLAEELPFQDAAFDAVVATLVFCTVADVRRALHEVRRVLRPGGSFFFIEHVRGSGWLGTLHDVIAPVWRYVGAGCHPNRRTELSVKEAGFDIVEVQRQRLGLTPVIVGIATLAPDRHRRLSSSR
ncbi:MAG: class I SAM-dependent methyltransferase [Chloroflexi bacterium]|nr:class I SAM-dependent methyltransferase [Chloroflexota bacterium]